MKRRLGFTLASIDEGWFSCSTPLRKTEVLAYARKAIVVGLFIFVLTPLRAHAQEKPQVFSLPEARVGEAYRANVEDVLRERYGLKLQAGGPKAILLWSVADGEAPMGIAVRSDGTIAGTLTATGVDDYEFRLKVIDVSVKDEALILNFSL